MAIPSKSCFEAAAPPRRINYVIEFRYKFKTVPRRSEIPSDGIVSLRNGDRVIIELQNEGDNPIFVSVFNISVAGKISLVSSASPRGAHLQVGDT